MTNPAHAYVSTDGEPAVNNLASRDALLFSVVGIRWYVKLRLCDCSLAFYGVHTFEGASK